MVDQTSPGPSHDTGSGGGGGAGAAGNPSNAGNEMDLVELEQQQVFRKPRISFSGGVGGGASNRGTPGGGGAGNSAQGPNPWNFSWSGRNC